MKLTDILSSFHVNWGLSAVYFAAAIFVSRYGHLGAAVAGILCAIVFLVIALSAYVKSRRR